ncbi:MAG: hypothetical protein WCO09_05190 [bacterium]
MRNKEKMTRIVSVLLGRSITTEVAGAMEELLGGNVINDGHRVNWAIESVSNLNAYRPCLLPNILGADIASCADVNQFGDFLNSVLSLTSYKPITRFTAGLMSLRHYDDSWELHSGIYSTEQSDMLDVVASLLRSGDVLRPSEAISAWTLKTDDEVRALLSSVSIEITRDPRDVRLRFAVEVMRRVGKQPRGINKYHLLYYLINELAIKTFNQCVSRPEDQLGLLERFYKSGS